MKKLFALALALCMIFAFAACGQKEKPAETAAAPAETEAVETEAAGGDTEAAPTGDETVLHENINVEVGNILSLGKSVEGIDVDTDILNAVDVLEAELGKATIDGHLTTFETNLLVIARTSLGTLVTTGGSATFTRAGTTSDTFGMMDGTFCGLEII